MVVHPGLNVAYCQSDYVGIHLITNFIFSVNMTNGYVGMHLTTHFIFTVSMTNGYVGMWLAIIVNKTNVNIRMAVSSNYEKLFVLLSVEVCDCVFST